MSTMPLAVRAPDLTGSTCAAPRRQPTIARMVASLIGRFRHRLRVRATERALDELSDETLRDLGLHRSEIGRAAREAIERTSRGLTY